MHTKKCNNDIKSKYATLGTKIKWCGPESLKQHINHVHKVQHEHMDTEKLCSVAISIKHKYVYAIGKNPTPTLTRDKAKMEYTSGRQPSSYELTFRVHFKMVL